MVGITLSPEQINQWPPDVRRWLEQQVANTLGLYRPEPAMRPPERHLIGCDLEAARAILAAIQGVLPLVSVFFELGRDPVATSPQGLRALPLEDMAHHARLHSAEQLVACLQAINEALQRVGGSTDAVLTAMDGEGHCLVADVTARSILALWQEIVAARNLTPEQPAAPYTMHSAPYTVTTTPA